MNKVNPTHREGKMSEGKPTDQIEDQELHDLLDSALQDFNKTPAPEAKDESSTQDNEPEAENSADDSAEDAWTKDFIRQIADQFEESLQHLMQNGTEGELGAATQRMAETMASTISEAEAGDADETATVFQSAITTALNDLTATSENLQNDAGLSELLAQTGLEDRAEGMLSFMQTMLHQLLSKEMLYPPLKQVIAEYPGWLEQKKDTLSSDIVEKLTKQLDLMKKVCSELETEKEDDTEEVRKRRFEAIVSLMEEAQNYGPLPEELVGVDTSRHCSVM